MEIYISRTGVEPQYIFLNLSSSEHRKFEYRDICDHHLIFTRQQHFDSVLGDYS